MQKDNNDKDIGSRIEKWFEELDKFNDELFFPDREWQVTPERHVFGESTK